MTENKALELMESLVIDTKCELAKTLDFKGTVIRALEDLQQYRAIGTVEQLINTQIREKLLNVELESYKEIGTIEEFKALKEKSVAKKPIKNNPQINEFYVKEANLCPSCHSYINNCSGDYCRDCAQKLDWH